MRAFRPRRVRTRLTLLYVVLFMLFGVALLGILYVLVLHAPRQSVHLMLTRQGQPADDRMTSALIDSFASRQGEDAARRKDQLQQLLTQSVIALAIMAVLSLALSWVISGRLLRPLRAITTTVRRISARNLHERLAAAGPDDELKDLSDTIDGLLSRLESAMDAHKRFVANAAHELSTPLTLQHALIEEALLDPDADAAALRASLARILRACQGQARLLESLLTLTTGERGLDRADPVDLAALAAHAVRDVRPRAGRLDLRLDADLSGAPVEGDADLLGRLIANLLDNAVSYNVPGGSVRVSTGIGDGVPFLSVVNTGPSVPADQVDRLFDPFQRLDPARGRDGHHGLGLSIVRAIATAHDAEIEATPRADGGLRLRVAFRRTGPREERRTTPAASAAR